MGLPLGPQAAHAAGAPTYDFVTRNGTQLMLDGKPFVFTGLNVYNANSDGYCGAKMSTGSALDDALTAFGRGKEVIRSWFFQPFAINRNTGERDWSAFDHTLQVAGAHGMKVIATLTNQWGDCEGSGYKYPDWYTDGYRQVQPGMLVSYRDWVAEVVQRYKDDPRIAFWQLINEAEVNPDFPAACPTGDLNPYIELHDWADDVSRLVKSIDPNHLVSLGTIGNGQCGADGPRYYDVHGIPTIDLCEFHDYGSPNVGIPGDQYNGLQLRIDQCNLLNKPIFVGEAGIKPTEVGGTLQARANAFQGKIDAQFQAGVRGFLAWAWSPQQPPVSTLDNYDIGPGDPAFASLIGPSPPPQVTVTGQAQLVSAPASVLPGKFESNTTQHAFIEQGPKPVPSTTTYMNTTGTYVDISKSGTYNRQQSIIEGVTKKAGTLSPATISPQTSVSSFFFHMDPVGASTKNVVNLTGTLSFAHPVVGIEILDKSLNDTDAYYGSPGTTYPNTAKSQKSRGLDFTTTKDMDSIVLSSDKKTVTLHTQTSDAIDQVRIFTAGDLTPPETTITYGPDRYAQSSNGFLFTYQDDLPTTGYSFECRVNGAPWVTCSSPYDPANTSNEGTYVLDVRAIDASGNVEPWPATWVWTIDRTAPNTFIDSGPVGPTSATNATFTFSSSDADSGFTCYVDNPNSGVRCASPYTATNLPDGTHVFGVYAHDQAGNVDATPATQTWTVDTIPPKVVVTSTPADPSNSSTAQFTFYAIDATQVQFRCNIGGPGGGFVGYCSSPFTWTVGDGQWSFWVYGIDAAGNYDNTSDYWEANDRYSWSVDTVPPPVPSIDSGPTDPTSDTSASFTFSDTEIGVTYLCALDGSGFDPCTSPRSYNDLSSGTHSFSLRSVDTAGNQSGVASFDWTVN